MADSYIDPRETLVYGAFARGENPFAEAATAAPAPDAANA